MQKAAKTPDENFIQRMIGEITPQANRTHLFQMEIRKIRC
jgi:hypothetical protein